MASTTEINIGQQIQFFGSLVGTTGLSEANNDIANQYVNRLLIALEPFVKDYEEEAKEIVEERKKERARIEAGEEDEGPKIIAPSSFDMNNLKIK